MSTKQLPVAPKRSEIWMVNFDPTVGDPTVGAEIQKKRPAVVVSSDYIGKLPLKLVAPITEWNDKFIENIWHVKIIPNSMNGLVKPSAVDALQVRSMDTSRFIHRMGNLSANEMENIVAAIVAVIEHQG